MLQQADLFDGLLSHVDSVPHLKMKVRVFLANVWRLLMSSTFTVQIDLFYRHEVEVKFSECLRAAAYDLELFFQFTRQSSPITSGTVGPYVVSFSLMLAIILPCCYRRDPEYQV